ncbi:MAG TPA: hypothetical protein DDY13_03165 [Cytophagales bacterium]|jgi:hypothetical protein|nr:hypothetical protein [Cytophagales bacterium]
MRKLLFYERGDEVDLGSRGVGDLGRKGEKGGFGELRIWDEREKTINPLNPALNEMREEIQKA